MKLLIRLYFLSLFAVSHATFAASIGFLQVGDIRGGSTDPMHPEWIDVEAWKWNVERKPLGSGRANTSNGVSVVTLTVTKRVDSSTSTLLKSATDGTHYDQGTLVVRRAESHLEYIRIHMEDIFISSVSTGGSGGEDRLTENVTLNFGKATTVYTDQKPDGSEGETVEHEWSKVNKKK